VGAPEETQQKKRFLKVETQDFASLREDKKKACEIKLKCKKKALTTEKDGRLKRKDGRK
jgi:hypothetical protein